MKINGIVRLCIIAASLVCSVLASFAQADGLSFDVIEPKVNSVISKAPMMIEISFRSPIDVTSFEAYIDSKLLIKGNLRTPMPNGHFSVPANYQTLRLTPGKHFFTVKLFDVLGKVAQRTVGITLQNSITAEKNPPTVKITNPIDNSVIQKDEDVQITVEASDDSGIKWVLVYINDDVRAMMNVAPYIAPWNPVRENFKAGAYIITAKAIDLFENPATSKPVRVRFEPFQRTNLPIIEAYNPIASGSAVFPTFGNVYNRFSPADLLNQGWADGIPTGLPQMMTNVDSRLMVMANSAVNQFGTVPMRIAPENINETIAGSPVLALTMPPALSAISGMVNPMSIKGYSYTPMYVSLPAPTGEALPRTGVSENPLVPTETIGSKTATTTTIKNTVVNTAQTVSQLPGVGKTNIPQQDVVLGKGKFTGNPSTLDTPNATDQRVADLSNPMMIAKLPGKVSTGIEIPKIDAAVIASATTIANTPSTGADTTKINNTATTTLTRPNANAPLVENNINGKNVQTVNPGITANNPTRVTPQITAPANTGTANVASTTGNTPATGGDANKIANTSSTSLTRPGANAPALDNSVTGKNVQTATPGITANNPTRVTPQITAPATSGATDVANSTGVAPTTGNDNIKPVTLSNGQIAPTRSNVTVGEKNGAPRSVAAAVPTVKGSSSKISPQATNTTSTVNTVIAKSSTVSPANPTVNQQTVAGTKITTRSDPANPTTIATTGRIVDSTTPEVKIASGVKPHGQPTIGTQSPAIITNNSTTVNPTMGGDVTKGSASSTNVSTRGNVSDLSQTPSTTSRNTVTTTPDVKIAGSTIHQQATPQVQGPATAIVSTSTTVKPTMGGDVTKGSASSTNVSTRGNVSDLSQTPSTTSRNTVTTTPDVKIATGTKGQPTIGTQSPAIITNNSTTVNPTMGGDVTKGSASSTNVSTRGNVSDLSQTPSTTIRNTGTTTPDVKIAGSTIHQQATPQVQGPATAIVSTSTTVKPSTTGNVAKPVATNTNVTTPVDIKNTTTTSAGNRNNTTSQPGINKTGNQTRITTTVTTNRNNIVVPVVNPSQQVTTIDVVANYVTTKGETLQKIAKANNVSEAELLKINPGLSQKAALSEGTSIKIKQQPATLYVDNSQIKGYPMPMLVNGSAMVPFRAVVQAKDGTVVWIADKKEVNAWLAANKAFIKMKIGDKTATVNNQKVTMKNAPMIEKSRTMVEVSYLAEAMNLEYKYEPLSNTYCFVSKK